MILDSFYIRNYRSIFRLRETKFSLTLTTLLGENNQGKSNILNAILLGFNCIKYFSVGEIKRRPFLLRELNYNWEIDFPIQKQHIKKYVQKTVISLTFCLSKTEIKDFEKDIGIKTSKYLAFKITFEEKSIEIVIISGTKDKTTFEPSFVTKICSWILERIDFQYIPTKRTADLADDIVNKIVSLELSQLANKKREQLENALNKISELQKPIIKKIEQNISATLREFIPNILDVSLNEDTSSYRYSRRFSDNSEFYIKINDGSDTPLKQKGDGIQSLVTLGMMRQKGKNGIGKGLILAIEEPETHLHPAAIRQISKVVNDIAQKNQVLISTHSPLFVNRDNIESNIIVKNNSAKKANNMKEIRDSLGVIASDNLINSDFIIVVEGETDKILLQKYFYAHSNTIKDWIINKRLGFEVLNGVYNLEHSLNKLLNMSSKYFCILDSDRPAKNHVKSAKNKSFLSSGEKEVCYYTLLGLNECELEDLIKPEYYIDYLVEKTGINIKKCPEFCKSNKKWSERIKDALKVKGKLYDDDELKEILGDVKKHISDLDIEIDEILISNRTSSIDSFSEQIEQYFKNKGHPHD